MDVRPPRLHLFHGDVVTEVAWCDGMGGRAAGPVIARNGFVGFSEVNIERSRVFVGVSEAGLESGRELAVSPKAGRGLSIALGGADQGESALSVPAEDEGGGGASV